MSYRDLDEFLASPENRKTGVTPVVFIGIDGAAWEYIDPLIERGELPNLARMKSEGAWGDLQSIPCYVSPPSWATMLTGALPEKTGVYTYGRWDSERREFTNVNGADVQVPGVWHVASLTGRRVGVFNVPMSYPPTPVDGVMVTGMMTPYEMTDPPETRPLLRELRPRFLQNSSLTSFSPIRRSATQDSLNVYLWALYDTDDDQVQRYDRVELEVYPVAADAADALDAADATETTAGTDPRILVFDVGRFSPWIQILARREGRVEEGWCRFAILPAPDGHYDTLISPVMFAPSDTYTYPDSFAVELDAKFGFYIPSVFLGEELVPDMATDAVAQASYFYNMDDWDLFLYVFTQSDNAHHLSGFSPTARDVYRSIDGFVGQVMAEMPPNGVLIVASDHGFREYTHGVNLTAHLQRLGLLEFDGDGRVDYESSLVFHNLWHLYFNRELITRDELARRGIDVAGGEDPVDAFARHLQQELSSIRSADGRRSFSLELSRYSSESRGETPDMAVRGTYEQYVVDFLGFENPYPEVIRQLEGRERWWHKRDGMFAAWGAGVRRGADAGRHDIQDIAPTILYLLGVPLSKEMDGTVMHGVFEARLLAKQAVFTVDDYSQLPATPAPRNGRRESLEKKLRSLGYMQ